MAWLLSNADNNLRHFSNCRIRPGGTCASVDLICYYIGVSKDFSLQNIGRYNAPRLVFWAKCQLVICNGYLLRLDFEMDETNFYNYQNMFIQSVPSVVY